VIVVFTKFDMFKREIRMKLEDQHRDLHADLDNETENVFDTHFKAQIGGSPLFVRLESKFF
jgi:hypothetical protein